MEKLNNYRNELLMYCNFKGIEVVRAKNWRVVVDEDSVTIREVWRGKTTTGWIYSMLHELGHTVIHGKKNFAEKYYRTYEIGGHVAIDLVASAQIMKEEIEAWDQGLKLAKKLGIKIDRKDYERYASKCLMNYMRSIPKMYDFWKNFKMSDLETTKENNNG